jgi:hypothetical protein
LAQPFLASEFNGRVQIDDLVADPDLVHERFDLDLMVKQILSEATDTLTEDDDFCASPSFPSSSDCVNSVHHSSIV